MSRPNPVIDASWMSSSGAGMAGCWRHAWAIRSTNALKGSACCASAKGCPDRKAKRTGAQGKVSRLISAGTSGTSAMPVLGTRWLSTALSFCTNTSHLKVQEKQPGGSPPESNVQEFEKKTAGTKIMRVLFPFRLAAAVLWHADFGVQFN